MSAVKTPSAMSGSILPRVILRSVRLQAALKAPQYSQTPNRRGVGLVHSGRSLHPAAATPLRTSFNNRREAFITSGRRDWKGLAEEAYTPV